MQHEHTEHVAASPDAVYAAISDVANLPRFIPQMIDVRPAGEARVQVDARYEGQSNTARRRFTRIRPNAGSNGARRAVIAGG